MVVNYICQLYASRFCGLQHSFENDITEIDEYGEKEAVRTAGQKDFDNF